MGTIILIVYLAGCMVFLVPIARFILDDSSFGENDTGDYWMAALGGLCCCWIWPLLIPGWWVVQMLKGYDDK